MTKPTVRDIAKEAGVSLATVDRVLNARPGVREKTVEKVRAAISKLGYTRDTYAANLARQRQYKFAFVLPEGRSEFIAALKVALNEAYATHLADRVTLKIAQVPAQDPHAIVRTLQSLSQRGFDAIAIMAPETPQVRDAIGRLEEDGVRVVAFVSDLPTSRRDYFIGINNVAAGRTAALLMGKFLGRKGEILVISNSMRSRDSLDRRLGFDQVMAEDFPSLTVLPSVETFNDPVRIEQIVAEVAVARRGVAGVYSMGSGNALILDALRRSGRMDDLTIIAHEVTPATAQALRDNEMAAVITQNIGHLVRSALRVLRSLCDDLPVYEAQERIRIDIVLRENLP